MKKNKILILLGLIIAFISLFLTDVHATDTICKVNILPDKEELKQGDIVTLGIQLTDIAEKGVSVIVSEFGYDEEIFELVEEQDEEIKEIIETDLNFGNLRDSKILYSGNNETDSSITNSWNILYTEREGVPTILCLVTGNAQKQNQVIGKIKLKVKENVEEQETPIQLTNIIALDGSALGSDSDQNVGISELEETNVTLSIKRTNTQTSNEDDGFGDDEFEDDEFGDDEFEDDEFGDDEFGDDEFEDDEFGDDEFEDDEFGDDEFEEIEDEGLEEDSIKDSDIPYTGIEDYIPMLLIILIIGIISYVKYRKYREI